jgi:hypothetical protein
LETRKTHAIKPKKRADELAAMIPRRREYFLLRLWILLEYSLAIVRIDPNRF